MRSKRENDAMLLDLCRRKGRGIELSLDHCIGSTTRFVTESLPFLRCIAPIQMNHALENLHSMSKTYDDILLQPLSKTTQELDMNAAAAVWEKAVEEQHKILALDDILDDDDDDDTITNTKTVSLHNKPHFNQRRTHSGVPIPSFQPISTSMVVKAPSSFSFAAASSSNNKKMNGSKHEVIVIDD